MKTGITVKDVYWTMGAYDGLLVVDAPDEPTVASAMADLGAMGNVRTQTMRAFDESEIGAVVGRGQRSGGGGGAGGGASGGGRSKR
jgi:uncharacterized protein with GYD domain